MMSLMFVFCSHNERRTQWEDPRLQAIGMAPPTDHMGMHRPAYPGGAEQLTHQQPHPHHMSHYPPAHYQMRHPVSLDITPMPGMGGLDMLSYQQRPHSAHQHSHSFAGHMHSHMTGGGHYGAMGMHSQLQAKRSFDISMMEQHKVPVTLQGDPYLSEHGRQASHDSGLGYPVTPYQGDQGLMEYEEGFDNGLQSVNHMGGGGASNHVNQERGGIQGVAVNHGLLDHLPGAGELGGDHHPQQMEFGGEMLGEFGNHGFPSGEWV